MAIQTNFPNIKPTLLLDFANVKALDPRITFTRASEGRYYDGKTFAKAEENLLLQSQDFTTSWTTSQASVVANSTAAPDGTTTAETLSALASTNIHLVGQAIAGSASTRVLSVFVKKHTHDFIQLCIGGDAAPFANFNLATGVAGTAGVSVTSAIQDVGNGWYRCSMVFVSAAGGLVEVAIVSSASAVRRESWTTTGTESVYLWGAQLEQRSSVTSYTATTTQPITNYIPVLMTAANGVARFDHNPTTEESLGLLIEEQRTNLLTYSEQFDNAAWAKNRSSITANTIVAPDGTLTGDKHIPDTQNSVNHNAQRANLTVSATQHALSVYAKQGEYSFIEIGVVDSASYTKQVRQVFDLSTGAVGNKSENGGYTVASASITPVGNGWYRCVLVTSTLDANSTTRVEMQGRPNNAASTSYTGDGYSGLYIWGAQLEAGSGPATSYIPTVAAQVTRSADAASMTGTNFSSWYRQDEGTLYADARINGGSATTFPSLVAMVGANANTDSISITWSANSGPMRAGVRVNSSGVVDISAGVNKTAGDVTKVAFAYKTNDFQAAFDGVQGVADTSGTLPVASSLVVCGPVAFQPAGNYSVKKIAFYPARVTNAQLQALTS